MALVVIRGRVQAGHQFQIEGKSVLLQPSDDVVSQNLVNGDSLGSMTAARALSGEPLSEK